MKRKITEKLLNWKNSPDKKCLMLFGARQVGKTYSVESFARDNYPSDKIISVNFELFPEAKAFFENDLSPKAILNKMQINAKFMNVDFKDDENNPYFIFLDEIQACPKAIVALKAFSMQSRLFHVVASVSLLGVALRRSFGDSYPVGYVSHLQLKPLDFEEFLWANGFSQSFVDGIKSVRAISDISPETHSVLTDMFRKFIVIGGLPAVVKTFVETNDFRMVYSVQNDLRLGYIQDIRKYASDNSQRIKVEKCFGSIPFHLKEQNKKFMYKRVEHNGRERMFGDSLSWLEQAGLVLFCYNLKELKTPLQIYKIDKAFKLFMFDTGILVSMFEEEKRYKILNGDEDLDVGGIYENAVACVLDHKKANSLYYYNLPDIDIDFVTEKNDNPTLLEVKSGNTLKSPSLNRLISEDSDARLRAIKISAKIVYTPDIIKNAPFYMFALLDDAALLSL